MNSDASKIFLEVGKFQQCKHSERAPGDTFTSMKNADDGRVIAVLSDGLGSGVKANVLSTLTATIAAHCVSEHIAADRTAEIVAKTLPICSRRHISYATFTIVDVSVKNEAVVIEYDNPAALIIRDGQLIRLDHQNIAFPDVNTGEAAVKKNDVIISRFQAQLGDRIVFYSDGVTQSGMGSKLFPLGWGDRGVRKYVLDILAKAPHLSARDLARLVVNEALTHDSEKAKDDITCAVAYFREPRELLLISGPPFRKESDSELADAVRHFKGVKIACGGTTANILSRELKVPIYTRWETGDAQIPPVSEMEGLNLVTEGVITLSKVEELLDSNLDIKSIENKALMHDSKANGAIRIVDHFLNADTIHFLIGTKLNEMHHDPSIPVELEARRSILKRIARLLETKYLKQVDQRFL